MNNEGDSSSYQITLHIAGISIAVAIHSLDPLECRRGEESCSIDIALRWSAKHFTKETSSKLVIE